LKGHPGPRPPRKAGNRVTGRDRGGTLPPAKARSWRWRSPALPAQTAALEQAAPAPRAGVGKADIQPPDGYGLGGRMRADLTAQGQHTRLPSRALVLEHGGRKVALVQDPDRWLS
jgi:hypothetical protein